MSTLAANPNYRLLFSASAVSNLGDGISALAFPWLATLLTRDPILIAAVAAAGRLPWLLFAAPAGLIADRMDRRRVLVWSDLVRMTLTVGVILLIFTLPQGGARDIHIWTLAGLAFALGSAEVVRDNAAQTALPSIVEPRQLEAANGQIWSVEQVMGSFVGPPLAGFLIAVAVPLPFAVDAVTFAAAACLVAFISFPARRIDLSDRSLWSDLKEGTAWLWQHHTILRLAVLLGAINATHLGYMTLLILYSQEVLGLGPAGHGVLMMAAAAGGVAGGLLGPALVARLGAQRVFLVAQIFFLAEPLAVYLTSSAVLVGLGMGVSMGAAVTYNIVTVSYRQRVIPNALLGRVNSLYRLLGWGFMPFGAMLGGWAVSMLEPVLGRDEALRMPFLMGAIFLLTLLLYSAWVIRLPAR
ncbi:MAG: MFS transporter [Pseudomonadota bacterium]